MEAAATTGRSPKRRRTDNRSVSSPEQIIQTNATVQRILGTQRQNRWLSGYVAATNSRGSDDINATNGLSAQRTGEGPPRSETGTAIGAETTPQRVQAIGQTSISDGLSGNDEAARANAGLAVGEAGTSEATTAATALAAGANIVDYESPYSSLTFAMPTTTTPAGDTTNHAHFPPGLPSPATTDETSRSPTTVSSTLTTNMTDSPAQPRKRGRPPKNAPSSSRANDGQSNAATPASRQPTPRGPPANPFSNTGTGRSFQRSSSSGHGQGTNEPPQGQYQSTRPNTASIPAANPHSFSPFASRSASSHTQQRNSSFSPQMPANGASSATQQCGSSNPRTPIAASSGPQQRNSSSDPSTPAVGPSNTQQGNISVPPLNSAALTARLDEFERTTPNLRSEVDRGRLTLLREAIAPQSDWFYLILSQVYALHARPANLPQALQSLPPGCWTYVENILAPNNLASPALLEFLGEFPASVRALSTAPSKSRLYNEVVEALEKFLRGLPDSWDKIVRFCQQIQVPPIVQDLAVSVKMNSRVLQQVAFRAINRMISNAKDDVVSAQLEILHRYDRQAYDQRILRQRDALYYAFQKVRNSYALYLQQASAHNHSQQRLPPHVRRSFPPFDLSFSPDVALVVQGHQAQVSPLPNAIVPSQHVPSQQQARPPSQQQQRQQQPHTPISQQQARASPQQQRQQPLTPMQQHEAMVVNAQRLTQTYGPPPRTASYGPPPASSNMAQHQGSYGNNHPIDMSGHSSNANFAPMPGPSSYGNSAMPMPNQSPYGYGPTTTTQAHPTNGNFPAINQDAPLSYRFPSGVTMPVQRHPPNPRHLAFPHEHDQPRNQPTEPNSMRSALHQAHLRSPVSMPLEVGGSKPVLYRYVKGYLLCPKRIHKGMGISTFDTTFDLPQDMFAKIPKAQPSRDTGYFSSRAFTEESRLFRLRSCWTPPNGFQNENDWILADTYWPEDVFVEVNGIALEIRRPLQHKKYLPINLCDAVKAGTNTLKIAVNRMSTDNRDLDFSLAVEIVRVVSHNSLLDKVQNQQIARVAKTKNMITKATSGAVGNDDDDDIAITTSSMTITLFDPFTNSKIFDIPIRGQNCKHIACFDLETFLSQCKREKPDQTTVVDCWRCPICRGDVRPPSLVRDEWLVGVRKALETRGALDTRAILVDADGSWKPKPEAKTGVRSASLEREERAAAAAAAAGSSKHSRTSNQGTPAAAPERKKKKPVEIIELD